MRRIKLESVKNFRDLGGYGTKDLKVTKFNKFYRSSVPTFLTKEELEFFKKNNLVTIIDLRNKEELVKKVNIFSTLKGFNYYNVELLGGEFPKREKDIAIGYLKIIDDKESMKHVFNIIKESSGSVLINCNVGKDRTGVVCMLLLLVAGVFEDDILADYELSYTYLREDIRKMHLANPRMPKYLGNSKMEYMEEALKLFKDKYGTINSYMKLLGFSKEEIKQIARKLVE